VLHDLQLLGRTAAFKAIHHPNSMSEVSEARNRLVLDELLRVQLVLRLRKMRRLENASGIAHRCDSQLLASFHDRLPFELTAAQQRTMSEVEVDLKTEQPMHRLLQGDVGAGKTLVALHALLIAVADGHQGALMAPTEVLADQHYLSLVELAEGLEVSDDSTLMGVRPLSIKVLTNRITGTDRQRVVEGMGNGSVDLVIGTHALIQEGITFSSLSVVVVDEQH
jgi:ATP-dependent DNA helicase RecG